jgi:hypothetical protein
MVDTPEKRSSFVVVMVRLSFMMAIDPQDGPIRKKLLDIA